jgi:hypothetical protein
MSIFVKQKCFCNICGLEFMTDFQSYGGRVCGSECWGELKWRETLAILGKDYVPQESISDKTVSDGFGNTWGPCPDCGEQFEIVRPGKVQCATVGCPNAG